MRYTEVDFLIRPAEPWRDLLMVELMELGYESFEETTHGLKAYMATRQFNRLALDGLQVLRDPHVTITFGVHDVPDINWNARWEREFQPVEVDGRVRVRAEFHPVDGTVQHDIVITPRMAFGTGHHATTRMMVKAMLGMGMQGSEVCDLGCGTAVLAILAERLGAARVLAIDNDQAAVDNARENVARNGCQRVVVEKGGTEIGDRGCFGTILANIERNTLVRAMPEMVRALATGGKLLLSGFIKADEDVMASAASACGLKHVQTLEEGEWALSEWEKTNTAERA
ncbi:MAG: 50S ribosomal protein L11 methyltransferase [Bacteroidetes bacterium]|nr:50S ribosomal protein L11 methyltransferase [Bacteroidota bacterium]